MEPFGAQRTRGGRDRVAVSRRPHTDVLHLAGWLFADLLLGFGIVVLAASGGGLPRRRRRAADGTTTTSGPPTSTTTAPPAPLGVEQTPVEIVLQADYDVLVEGLAERDAEVARLAQELRAQLGGLGLGGRRAALVLTFGFHPEAGNGQQLASAFNQDVLGSVPEVFASAVPRNFDWRGSPIGQVHAEVYLFTPSASSTPLRMRKEPDGSGTMRSRAGAAALLPRGRRLVLDERTADRGIERRVAGGA